MISRIGKYSVEAELGRGGFGQVYRAWDPDVRQPVAIKVLLAGGEPDLLKRFQLEIVTTASLHHKNIVTIHASGEQDGAPYLVMELLEGQTFAHILKEKVELSLVDKVRIMTQVAEGLAYAHSKGVVHRDVKPANIMLLPDGSVKIMDFGIALASELRTVGLTMDGFVLGTMQYMSPEQLTFESKANEQTDIFSYGDVYYELLTGRHPFESFLRDWNALRAAILMEDPPPVSQFAPDCPEALELLVHRAIAKEREFRYQTFEELRLDSAAVLVDLQHEQAAKILETVPRLVAAGELQAARSEVREAQKLEPGNREARQLLEKIDQQLREKSNIQRSGARIREAEKLLSERRFAEAVKALEAAAKLDKANTDVQARLSEAKTRLDGAVEASRLVEEARSKQAKGELPEALDRLDRALQADPEHSEARRLRPKISERLERLQRDQARQAALRMASERLAAKQYSEALSVLERLEAEQPGTAGAEELRRRVERERSEELRRAKAEKFSLALAKTRETVHAGDFERAGQMLTYLESNFSSEPGATELLASLREQVEAQIRAREIAAYRERANELLERQSFHDASALLALALERYPNDAGLQRQKASADALYLAHTRSEAIASVLERARTLRDLGDLQGALQAIEAGSRGFPAHAACADLAREIQMEIERQQYAAGLERLLRAVRELIAAGRNDDAIEHITRAKDYAGEAEVLGLLASARTAAEVQEERKSVEDALARASELRAQSDVGRAASLLAEARLRYPHSLDLSRALGELQAEMERAQRQEAAERYRTAILHNIEAGSWKEADSTLRQALLEFPGEDAFAALAERIEAGLRDAELQGAFARIRKELGAGDLSEAARLLDETRTTFAHDRRWRDLEEEVGRRRDYESKLAEAERQRREGNLDRAEALVTQTVANAPDPRARELLDAIQHEQAENTAVATRVRQCLERNDPDRAAEELAAWRTKVRDERRLAELEREISAQRESLRLQASMVEEVRKCLEREDIQRAATKLAEARASFPDGPSWPSLQADIDAHAAALRRRTEVSELAQHLRESIRRGQLQQATADLAAARKRYPKDSAWDAIKQEIEACRTRVERQAQVTAIAGRVRRHLDSDELAPAQRELAAGRRTLPDEQMWTTLEDEISARRAILDRRKEIAACAECVRECLRHGDTTRASLELAGARARYPAESVWAALQSEIDERRRMLERSAAISMAATAIRAHLEHGDVGAASSVLEKARADHPGEKLWAILHHEVEARRAELDAARDRDRRAEQVSAALAQAEALLRAERLEDAAVALRTAASRFPDEPRIGQLQRDCDHRRRLLEVRQIAARAEALLAQHKPQEAIDSIDARDAAEPLLRERIERARQEVLRQECHSKLLAIEQQAKAEPDRRRRQRLDRAARREAALFAGDSEISALADCIHEQIYGLSVASPPKGTLRWTLPLGALALVAIGILVSALLRHKPATIPIEIVTAPPGATVHIGQNACQTPNCRLDLTPGRYSIAAELNGYVRQQRTVQVEASHRLLEFTLEPLPPPPTPPGSRPATGTLVVQAGVAGALVYMDGRALGRTDLSGSLTIPVEAKPHEVRVERNGYEKAAPRLVSIGPGFTRTLSFRLAAQPARLELDGAPAGVEVRLAGAPLGRTDGSSSFVFPNAVSPGEQTLEIAFGSAKHDLQLRFEPGQTEHLDWRAVAPFAPPPATPSPEEAERQDWDRIRSTSDVAQLQNFLRLHSSGAHATQAALRIADLQWSAVDQTSVEAVGKFLRENPGNPHLPEGRRIVDQFEARAKQQQQKQEAAKQEASRRAKQAELQRQVYETLTQLNSAFEHNRPRELKAIWPGVGQTFLSAMATPRARISLAAREMDIQLAPQGGLATVTCNLVVNSNGATTVQRTILTLRNNGGSWRVETAKVE